MKISKILIELKIEEKINKKHGIYREEIERTLFDGKPVFFKTKEDKYVAIGLKNRYITIIFTYEKSLVNVVTAYPFSEWQIKLYKKRRK